MSGGLQTFIHHVRARGPTDIPDRARITKVIGDAIETHFGFPVGLLVRSAAEIASVVAALPSDWNNDQTRKCDVFFLWDEADRPAILELLDYDLEIEDVRYTPGAVIRLVDRKNAPRSKLTRVVGTQLYQQMTIRNCNTTRKLLALMDERP